MSMMQWEHIRKVKFALIIALIFHVVGLIGIKWIDQDGFVAMTPYNLLLSLILILWTQEKLNFSFFIFFLVAFQTGFFTEYLGVNRQLLFGHYQYEATMGYKLFGVPLIIGVNWFMIVYCSAITIGVLFKFIWSNFFTTTFPENTIFAKLIIILFGAMMAMSFDWLMEPVAIKLGYWTWLRDGNIPVKNYWDWFFVSAFLIFIFMNLNINRKNLFAVCLLLIQSLFFISLRLML